MHSQWVLCRPVRSACRKSGGLGNFVPASFRSPTASVGLPPFPVQLAAVAHPLDKQVKKENNFLKFEGLQTHAPEPHTPLE